MAEFRIIQGGMGVGVSGWRLAKAVSQLGQIGVVSGTGLAVVLVRRLELGDSGGHVRRAMAHFPIAGMAQRVLDRHFIEGGKDIAAPYGLSYMPQVNGGKLWTELTVLANFVEVFLAKEGHDGLVGVNYLEKMQIPTLPSLFGAMLAGGDYVLMGAGVPRFIPGALDQLAKGQPAELRLDVEGAESGEQLSGNFDPMEFCGGKVPALRRPKFLAIISSATLAVTLARKSNGHVDGFVIEGATAGGHNAPPRGPMQLSVRGEPVYGVRDEIDLEKIRELGLPFWLAGGFGSPEKIAEAKALGASGVQVGTAFAFCDESEIRADIKRRVVDLGVQGGMDVFTDPAASPTGFPFKVVRLAGSLSEPAVYAGRARLCDIGYLRRPYRREDGTVGYRCAAEPVEQYVSKGGRREDTVGRICLCNALFATIGLGQSQKGGELEASLVTAGDDVVNIDRYVKPGAHSYTAAEVVTCLLAKAAVPVVT